MRETVKNGVFEELESRPLSGVVCVKKTGKRPEAPSKRRRIAVNKGCLQESRRRRYRRKPLWFSSIADVKKELSEVDLSKPALSRADEPQLNTIKMAKLTDVKSVKTIFEEQNQ
jgi:hypothetical protein